MVNSIDLIDYRAEDGGILDAWLDSVGDQWLYVTGIEAWHKWTGTHWQKDECQELRKQLQTQMRAMNDEAITRLAALPAKPASGDDPNAAVRAHMGAMIAATRRSSARVSSVAIMAQAQKAMPADTLDKANVLNLGNGTLDLDTLQLRPHNPADRLTYVLPYAYEPSATAPRWERFIGEVLVKEQRDSAGNWQTDRDLAELMQMAAGYALTPDTRHEKMFWLSGEGSNGKTTLLTVLQGLFGDLATLIDFHAMAQPGNYETPKLRGKRLALSTEATKGKGLAESIIKSVVSGEKIGAREIRQAPIEFTSTAKVFWAMNDKPVIKDTTNAIWRRLVLIPFNRSFSDAEKDTDLKETLCTELAGILNWALAGLAMLRDRGCFPTPKAVTDAVAAYRVEANPIAQWLAECATQPNAEGLRLDATGALIWTQAATCYASYREWADQNGRQAVSSTSFGLDLKKLVKDDEASGKRRIYQLGLLRQPEPTN